MLGLALGLISALCWSLSFYGQVWTNIKLKSVEGYSLEYQIFNQTGYICYFVYCTSGYFFNNPFCGQVDFNDILFSYHAIFIVTVISVQCFYYQAGKNKISTLAILLNMLLWVPVIVSYIAFYLFDQQQSKYFNFVSILGYIKLVISFSKYTPPAVMNCRRRSTKGWSIFNILLDILGGIFSLVQIGIEIGEGQINFSQGLNIIKLVLSLITVVYDSIFMVQHYCLFGQNEQYEMLASDL